MKIIEIQKLKEVSENPNEHDSIRKHFQIVQKVKYWLKENVPNKIILELIEEMELKQKKEKKNGNK